MLRQLLAVRLRRFAASREAALVLLEQRAMREKQLLIASELWLAKRWLNRRDSTQFLPHQSMSEILITTSNSQHCTFAYEYSLLIIVIIIIFTGIPVLY